MHRVEPDVRDKRDDPDPGKKACCRDAGLALAFDIAFLDRRIVKSCE